MLPAMQTLGVRFDINRIDSGSYGIECWKIFWGAVDPAALNGSVLYEGDSAASIDGRENVFCIAIQHAAESVIRGVRAALTNHPQFTAVCAPPRFVEGAACTGEPLVMAGKVSGGEILGDAWTSRPALEAVRKERGACQTSPIVATQSAFQCEKCGKVADHSRVDDPYAGELWVCKACGWKTMRDESQSWADVTPLYEGTAYEARYKEDMRDSRVRAMVDFLSLYMCGPFGFQDFTAAERSRIAHLIVRNWEKSDEESASELKAAGFSLEGRMSPPGTYVASVKKAGQEKYTRIMGNRGSAHTSKSWRR